MGWPIDRPVGLTHHDPSRSQKGYTLLSGLGAQDAVLLDMQGRAVHRWHFDDCRVFNVELLASGNLLALCSPLNPPPPRETGEGGRFTLDPGAPPELFNFLGGHAHTLRELDWDGNVVWRIDNEAMHHDFERLPNGNTLVLEWVELPQEIESRVRGGEQQPGQPAPVHMISDDIVELDANGDEVDRIHLWHLLDPEATAICPLENRWEWTHTNSLDVDDGGRIVFSSRNVSTVGIVERSGPGAASLSWTFGPPEITHQHHATLLKSGRVLIYDNGMHRVQDLSYSRIVEVDPATERVKVVYQGEPREEFYSAHISGVQRLENGNTLITEGASGRVFEVDRRGQVAWEWLSPFQVRQRGDQCFWVFRAWRYGPDWPGLQGRDLDAGSQTAFNRLHGLGS